jgi:hypothetical protein
VVVAAHELLEDELDAHELLEDGVTRVKEPAVEMQEAPPG